MISKVKLYSLIVNRSPAVKQRYEDYVVNNPQRHSKARVLSWAYLLWLNLCSPFLKERDEFVPYTVKGIESGKAFELSPEALGKRLCQSDVVSFDVFDTLIFRPFSDPCDVFYIVGQALSHPDFRNIRIRSEKIARERNAAAGGSGEVTIDEIYAVIAELTGLSPEKGIAAEKAAELSLCIPNPYMKKVWEYVKKQGRQIIVVSDMYLSSEFISRLLEKNGFIDYNRIYVSCEEKCGKYNGTLWKKIMSEYAEKQISHIGDNLNSDKLMAEKNGIAAVHYPNVNVCGKPYRTRDMSPLTGSAYRGLVNSKLYCGNERYSMQYEYGYKHGGLLILGYCQYIRKISIEKKCDKVLFFSRDGYIIKKVYDKLYPDSRTEYAYWSRNAAARLSFDIMPYDYFRRYIYQKTGGGFTFEQVLDSAGLSADLIEVDGGRVLDARNVDELCSKIRLHSDRVSKAYEDADRGARLYFSEMLCGCNAVLTVDCGWAGSGNIVLEKLVREKWRLPCRIYGVVAGTNGSRQCDSDYSETYFADGSLFSYCFSSSFNRDIYKRHDPSKMHNVYFEMLLGAPEPSFKGFGIKNGAAELYFDDECENAEAVNEIHRGEIDFINDYFGAFSEYDMLMTISGRDAYAPFACAIADKGDYMAKVFDGCVFDMLTSGQKEKI